MDFSNASSQKLLMVQRQAMAKKATGHGTETLLILLNSAAAEKDAQNWKKENKAGIPCWK